MASNIEVLNSKFIARSQMPVGIPFFYPTEVAWPDGVLELNGQTFSATDYPELAIVYPSLTLPDMRGVVARGLDRGSGRNTDAVNAAAGDYQEDAFQGHKVAGDFASTGQSATATGSNLGASATYLKPATQTGFTTDGTNGTPRISVETRGKAVLGYWLCFARTLYYDLSIEGGNAQMLGGHPSSYYASKQYIANLPSQQEPWIVAPALLNGWVNYESGYANAQYYKDSLGIVHLKGVIKSGTLTTPAFILPSGYRPSSLLAFSVISNNAFGRCDVSANGAVYPSVGTNGSFFLDGVSFRAEL